MSKVLMSSPDYFDVLYDINPWMSGHKNKVNPYLAKKQWDDLFNRISVVSTVEVLPGANLLPDLVFTANAGFIQGNLAVLSRFSKPERQPEEAHFGQWFREHGYQVIQPSNYYEGEGDHLIDANGAHWLGTGFRTSSLVLPELVQALNVPVNILELVDSRWYHLDTCFCPLPGGELVWYPPAFTDASQALIRSKFSNTFEVSLQDALSFCCNAVCVGREILLPENFSTSAWLEIQGYNSHEFYLSEFMKAGGAAKCLVLNCSNT